MNRLKYLFAALLALSMILSACQPAPAETPAAPAEATSAPAAEAATEAPAAEAPAAPAAAPVTEFVRSETFYMGGTQWGPPTGFNPWNLGNYAAGTFGLCYESLFIYDPLTDTFEPWLAESGSWTSDTTYEVKVRPGVTWSTGDAFTSADVKATFDIAKTAPVSISPVWNYLSSVEAPDDSTVVFTFSSALYQRWANFIYNTPIISAKTWSGKSVEDITSGLNLQPECTGPYMAESLDQTKVVWVKRDGWWAKDALGLDPAPKRVVDLVNSSNEIALGRVMRGDIDLNNNFLPGISTIVKAYGAIKTYYPEAPYHLSANTAWLLMNLTKKPMDDAAFRRAVAFAIDTDKIVNVAYGGMVMKANPTGLLPIWNKYVDQAVVSELGFKYDSAQAKQILADAGYKDVDGDGFVEAPDGSKIELKINNPNGWSDWMESNRIISEGLKAAGINASPNFPEYGDYVSQRNEGTFDMMIANDAQMSNTPWTYYDWMLQNPIEDIATIQNGNYGRYNNPEAFALKDKLDQVKTNDLEGMKAITSQLQKTMLTDMPLVPLWYNGVWSQVNTTYWTNWPSAADGSNHYIPASWRGYWNMTAIKMLCDLKPVTP